MALNAYVERRGVSGTSTLVAALRKALNGSEQVALIELAGPGLVGGTRVRNLVKMLRWDFAEAARVARDADVLVHPANVGTSGSAHVPSVVIMLDTMVLDHPRLFDRYYNFYARACFGRSVSRASRVLTLSEYSKGRILARWPGANVGVLPLPTRFPVVVSPREAPSASGCRPSVLMLGVTEPHKNHPQGIEAVRLLRLMTGLDVELAIAGPAGRHEEEVRLATERADPLHQWIKRAFLSDPAVLDALDRSWVLLQCSVDEGYCLPLIEAGARGLPVVHTGSGAMRELLPARGFSDSALSLASAMADLLNREAYSQASGTGLKLAKSRSPESFQALLVSELIGAASA